MPGTMSARDSLGIEEIISTWVLEETPRATNLAALLQYAICEVWVALLKAMGEAKTTDASTDDDHVKVERVRVIIGIRHGSHS